MCVRQLSERLLGSRIKLDNDSRASAILSAINWMVTLGSDEVKPQRWFAAKTGRDSDWTSQSAAIVVVVVVVDSNDTS